ncbi:MAG TPA: hypothetical protein VKF42_04210 [Chitinivibrionales bacterium]|jgi:hypothetical protein|nr:hypothetical protein [Chitinivibrionales bacterium]
MKKLPALFAIVATVLWFAPDAKATPSTFIWIPATDIQPFLNLHFGWDAYLNLRNDGLVSDGYATVGVLPFKKIQAEIGVDYRDFSGAHTYPWLFNAKIGTPEDAFFKYQPAFAIGGYDFGTRNYDANATTEPSLGTKFNLVYALMGKTIWKLGRVNVGPYVGAVASNKALFAAASDPKVMDNVGVMAAWDRTMNEISPKLWLSVDYQSGRSGYGALSLACAWSFSPNVSVIYGVDFYNDGFYHYTNASAPTFTMQLDANIF